MAKSKKTGNASIDQQIISRILAFLHDTSVEEMTGVLPNETTATLPFLVSIRSWKEGTSIRQQAVVMYGDVAKRFSSLSDSVYALATKRDMRMGNVPISEKNVETVLEECLARYIRHSVTQLDIGVDNIVRTVLEEAILSEPRQHTVLVPIYGLYTDRAVEFRGVRYSLPSDCPEYVSRMTKSSKENMLGIAPTDAELNSGFDVIAKVECRARFLDDAVHGAKEKVSRDLAILRYSAYREFRAASHLASPSVIRRERKPATLSTIAFDDQGKGTTQLAGFTISVETPLNLQEWGRSKWSAAIASAITVSQAQGDSVAACLLDALTWLGRSTVQEDDATRLLFQITALESLLPVDGKEEKVHQISLHTTVLGGMAGLDRRDTYDLLRRAYTVRSEVVHGSRMTTSKYEPDRIGMLLDRIIDFMLFNESGVKLLALTTGEFRNVLMEILFE